MLCGLIAPNIAGLRKVADALVAFGVLCDREDGEGAPSDGRLAARGLASFTRWVTSVMNRLKTRPEGADAAPAVRCGAGNAAVLRLSSLRNILQRR